LATCQIEEGISDLHKLFEKNLLYSSYLSTSGQWNASSAQVDYSLFMQPHSVRVGNKLLSELVMIKSDIKPQPV